MEQLTQTDIEKMSSIDLASMVIIHRALGAYKNEAKLCMIELMKRKAKGDNFDFEGFIKTESQKYQIKLNIPKFADVRAKMSNALIGAVIAMNKDSIEEKQEDDNDEEDNNDEDDDITS